MSERSNTSSVGGPLGEGPSSGGRSHQNRNQGQRQGQRGEASSPGTGPRTPVQRPNGEVTPNSLQRGTPISTGRYVIKKCFRCLCLSHESIYCLGGICVAGKGRFKACLNVQTIRRARHADNERKLLRRYKRQVYVPHSVTLCSHSFLYMILLWGYVIRVNAYVLLSCA